jgi:hypothetical protein
MRDIYSAWPIIIGATEGVNHALPLKEYVGLDSLLCMYINSVSSALGLNPSYIGDVDKNGIANIKQADDVEPFIAMATATSFVKEHGQFSADGELNFTNLLAEWDDNLKELVDGEKIDINVNSVFVNTLILQNSFAINVALIPAPDELGRMEP